MNQLPEKSPIDYLIIASQPPNRIAAGQKLTYKVDVRTKKGGLKFTLDAAPKGMTISPQGELTWDVPADFTPGNENIIVTIRDAAGQEVFHTFRLTIEAAGRRARCASSAAALRDRYSRTAASAPQMSRWLPVFASAIGGAHLANTRTVNGPVGGGPPTNVDLREPKLGERPARPLSGAEADA